MREGVRRSLRLIDLWLSLPVRPSRGVDFRLAAFIASGPFLLNRPRSRIKFSQSISSCAWAFAAMDSVFNLEDWLRQAGLDDGVIANVAAKLREEECASVSALKAANDASLQSIGIKAGSRNLILKACADLVNAPALRPGELSPYKDIPASGPLVPAVLPPPARFKVSRREAGCNAVVASAWTPRPVSKLSPRSKHVRLGQRASANSNRSRPASSSAQLINRTVVNVPVCRSRATIQ